MAKLQHQFVAQLNKLRRVSVSVPLVVALLATTAITFATVRPAQAAGFCECTTFVANYYGLSPNYPNAGLWGNSYLPNQGWKLEPNGTINGGDIAVFQGPQEMSVTKTPGCCYFNYWINTSAGHVAIVDWLQWHNTRPGYYTVGVQGANQGLTPTWTSSNCNNVSQFYWNTAGNYSGHWAFYYHP
jgi:hypothetical protein